MKAFFSRLSKLDILLSVILWIAVIAGIYFLAPKGISPVSDSCGVNATYPEEAVLRPGDVLTEEVTLPEGSMENLSLAFDYDPEQISDAQVVISAFYGDSLILEQALSVSAIPSKNFITFAAVGGTDSNVPYTICVENTSADPGENFSVLYTATPNLRNAGFSDFSVNGNPQTGKILCNIQYRTGYRIYPAICIAFCLLLAGLILNTLLLRRSSHRQ